MTPLRQRFIEDMQLRGLAPTTQRSYLHYVSDFAKFYNASPEHLDLEAVRQYELYVLHERKLSPESINTFVSAVQFLFLVTLEMPCGKECFPRVRRTSSRSCSVPRKSAGSWKTSDICSTGRTDALLWRRPAHLRSRRRQNQRHRLATQADPHRAGQGEKDRYVMLSPRLLAVLRAYYRAARPKDYLFPTLWEGHHMTSSALSFAAPTRVICAKETMTMVASIASVLAALR